MTRSVVDYENLMDTSFSDLNISSGHTSNLRPRWERKKQQHQQQQQQQQQQQAQPQQPQQQKQQHSQHLKKQKHSSSSSSQQQHQHLLDSSDRHPLAATSGDRFIPSRSGTNMEVSKHIIRTSSSDGITSMDPTSTNQQALLPDDQKTVSDTKKGAYESNLSSVILGVDDVKKNRIMSYQEKAPVPEGDTVNNLNILYSASAATSKKKSGTKLVSRQIPSAPSRVLDAPDLLDDYYLNLVSWSQSNLVAIALSQTVYVWNAGTGDIQELCTFDTGPNPHISSVAWVQTGGAHLAVGTSSGITQLWDVNECKHLRSMDGHTDRVGALSWNRHILSSGSRDTVVVNHDVRVSRHNVSSFDSHTQEVCGLSWSPDGGTLASGGNDNLLCIWDALSMSSSSSSPRCRFTDHQAAVKAVAWSPHERHLLATGGGTADRTIKFWNTQTCSLLNSIDTGSQVCALQWNPHEKEILSSHGFARNQLSLWKYPSMGKIKEFDGHSSRVLHMAVSPDGGTVLSLGADETLRFWDIFVAPAPKASSSMDGETKTSSSSMTRSTTDMYLQPTAAPKSSWTTQIR